MSFASLLLVILQLLCLAWFLASGNILADGILLIVQLSGLGLSLWGAKAMGLGKFNIEPEVKAEAALIQTGPYRWLRNPMYAGLLLFFGAVAASNPSLPILVSFLVLALVLLLKIRLEERFLAERFPGSFEDYKKRTYRLIPFIF